MTPAAAQSSGIRPHVVPLAIALLPLIGMACLQFSLAVLAPRIMPAMGRSPETYGVLTGMIGLGSVWFYVSSHRVVPAFGPLRMPLIGRFGFQSYLREGGSRSLSG